jgi:hypothetical protein
MSDSRVIIVMDREFGGRLRLLPEEIPAWVVDSPENHEVIVELWQSRKRWSESGALTSFVDQPGAAPEQHLISLLDTIDLHHGRYSQKNPWNIAQVVGARPLPKLIEAMNALGFCSHSESREGLEFQRKP